MVEGISAACFNLSWTVQYTLKKTEALTLRCTVLVCVCVCNTAKYLLFNSHHPVEHKLGVIRHPKLSGGDHAHKDRREGEGTEAHQGSTLKLWLLILDLCQNL